MIEKRYIGILSKDPKTGTPFAATYPEGTFSVVNQNGQLALMVIGQVDAIAADKLVDFKNLEEANKWIQNPS